MLDWTEYPMNEAVHWPLTQKVIGILGVAPLATADFFYRLSNRKVKKDWEHPRVIIDSNPKIPSRGRFLQLNETDPVPFIERGIINLARQGADIVAIPCNTAHILYDRYTKNVDIEVPNIISVTVDTVFKKTNPNTIVVLASQLTIEHKLYQMFVKNYFSLHARTHARTKIDVIDFEHQDEINSIISLVKNGEIYKAKDVACKVEKQLLQVASGSTVVILGCTELAIAFCNKMCNKDIVFIDSNQALADYCYEKANQNIDIS